jgi:ribose 5-phosphate isomerase B
MCRLITGADHGGKCGMPQERIGIGSDHAGFRLKESVRRWLVEHAYPVRDLGTDGEEACDYPDFAIALAEAMLAGEIDRGILICGTGVGMSIVANKYPHLRAAVCHDPTTARYSRAHNDANVLTLGSRVTGEMVALDIVNAWLHTPFEGGRHSRRLEKIERLPCRPASLPSEADANGEGR